LLASGQYSKLELLPEDARLPIDPGCKAVRPASPASSIRKNAYVITYNGRQMPGLSPEIQELVDVGRPPVFRPYFKRYRAVTTPTSWLGPEEHERSWGSAVQQA